MSAPVTSTYRFQLHADFPFDAARAQLPYLKKLGISHAYCSPILTAVPGSVHGYDVLDHTRVNPELGGREAFERFAGAAHELGLGVVVDVVPNHMAFVAPESSNAPLWALLAGGKDASTAHWFDVDWDALDGALGVPILGKPLDEEIADGSITLDRSGDEPVIRYYEHVFPVADGSLDGIGEAPQGDELARLLERQHYRLAFWRDRDAVLNYRRFFEVNELIAVRVETDDVFDATHALLLELHHAGHIDGFRIDHPDGLADPAGYLARLTQECRRGTPIWVEKILEPGEHLPSDWACAGTTGYDAMAAITAALADDAAAPTIEACWQRALGDGDARDVEVATREAKRFVVENGLVPEVERLTRRAAEVRPDLQREALRAAIVELLVAAPVYRAYLVPGARMAPESKHHLDEALEAAREARPDLADELDALKRIALVRPHAGADEFDDIEPAASDFAVRLQQTWGPVMAKSIEDTLFYRWHALTALNEVGGDVDVLVDAGAHRLNAWAQHNAEYWPRTMTTLSTHDTKRSEDVRAALLAIAGDDEAWTACSDAAFALADAMGVDRPAAALAWQTIAGFSTAHGPFDTTAADGTAPDAAHGRRDLGIDADRLSEYLTKALREAKVYTAWTDGDEAYEKQVLAFTTAVLEADDAAAPRTGESAASAPAAETLAVDLRRSLLDARRRNAEAITLTGHTQKVLELFLPGIPDTYQGSERPTLSLVDPDNRRPVDYGELEQLLDVEGSRPRLVQRCLAADVHTPANPGSGYEPLESDSEFLVAFERTVPAASVVRRQIAEAGRLVEAAGRQVSKLVKRAQGGEQTDAPTPAEADATPLAVAVIGVRAASRALRTGALADAHVSLPAGEWRHAFTGERLTITDAPVAFGDLGDHEFGHVHVLVQEKR